MPVLRAACTALALTLLAGSAAGGDGPPKPAWLPDEVTDDDALPPGAFARLGTTRFKHLDAISSVAASEDGRVVASASARSVVLWDAATGRARKRFRSGEGRAVRLAAGGNTLVAVNDSPEMRVIDLVTGGHTAVGSDDTSAFFQVAVSPDGSVVAAVRSRWARQAGEAEPRARFRITFWETHPFRKLREFETVGRIRSIGLSPRGERLAELWDDGRVHVRDAESGRELHAYPAGLEGPGLFGVTFSPSGRALTLKGRWRDTVVLDAETGKVLCHLEGRLVTENKAAFSPDAEVLAVAGVGGVRLVRVADGREVQRLEEPGNRTHAAEFVGDGKTLLTGGDDGQVRLWDLASGRERLEAVGHTTAATGLAFSPDGRRLASGDESGDVHVWDVPRAREACRLPRQSWHGHLALAPDGSRLAFAAGRSVTVWDTATGDLVRSEEVSRDDLDCVAFTRGGRSLLCVHHHDLVRYDAGTLAVERWCPGRANGPLHAVGTRRHGETWADTVAAAGRIRVWDNDGAVAVHTALPTGGASGMAVSPDGRLLAVCSSSECILRDVPRRVELFRWDLRQTNVAGDAFEFSADGRLLMAYEQSRGALVVEIATGAEATCLKAVAGHPGALAFSPDGRTLATATPAGPVVLWDLAGTHGKATRGAPSGPELALLWDELVGDDAPRAYRAVWRLAEAPAQAVPFLRQRLRPAEPVPAERVWALVTGLDNFRFATRQAAMRELHRVAESVEPDLREAIRQEQPVQVGESLGKILQALDAERSRPTGERLRALRAVQALEHMRTPESRAVLERLAGGAPGATLTREARAALDRLTR